MAHELVEEQPRDAPRVLRVGELRFFGESVFVQPVEQFRAVGRDDLHLRVMHMAVDKPRQQQVRPVVDGFGAGGGLWI